MLANKKNDIQEKKKSTICYRQQCINVVLFIGGLTISKTIDIVFSYLPFDARTFIKIGFIFLISIIFSIVYGVRRRNLEKIELAILEEELAKLEKETKEVGEEVTELEKEKEQER